MATVAADEGWLRVDGGDLLLLTRVQPRASRARIDGVEGGRLRLRVCSPPVDGQANRAVVDLLADALDLARGRFTIERGEHAREKDVRIAGAASARASIAGALALACAKKP